MRKFLALAVAVGVTLAAAGFVAPGASAAHTRNVYVCIASGSSGLGAQSILANPGDTIRVFNNCTNTNYGSTPGYVFRYPASNSSVWELPNSSISLSSSASAVVGALGSSSQVFAQSGIGNIMVLTVNAVSEPVPAPPPFEPHDYLQQVALPASGSCTDIPPESGHWHGTPFGGWSQSWAQWPNGGMGGPVCTRMVETTETGALIIIG